MWALLEPVFHCGETSLHDPSISEAKARLAWMEQNQPVMLGEDPGGLVVGTDDLRPNSLALGAHVANAGSVVADHCHRLGFCAMQFNLVVSTNTVGIRYWQRNGFQLGRVRDRMVGVTLGILMPLLVFNTLGIGALQNGLVLGGTAALVMAFNRVSYLRTALISSGVAFVGYGPMVAWYIPNRWIDYVMGCGLALAVGLLLFPNSALRRYNQLKADPAGSNQQLQLLLPAAQEEARWLGLPVPEPLAPELSGVE